MQGRTAKRHGGIDRQRPVQKLRQNVMCHPSPKPGPMDSIAPGDPQNAKFYLHQGDGGEIEGRSIDAGEPGNYICIGLSVSGFAQLGKNVGIEQEH